MEKTNLDIAIAAEKRQMSLDKMSNSGSSISNTTSSSPKKLNDAYYGRLPCPTPTKNAQSAQAKNTMTDQTPLITNERRNTSSSIAKYPTHQRKYCMPGKNPLSIDKLNLYGSISGFTFSLAMLIACIYQILSEIKPAWFIFMIVGIISGIISISMTSIYLLSYYKPEMKSHFKSTHLVRLYVILVILGVIPHTRGYLLQTIVFWLHAIPLACFYRANYNQTYGQVLDSGYP